jgi:predicted peptidase
MDPALKKRPASGPNKFRRRLMPIQIKARWILRKLKQRWADEKDQEIILAVDSFQQLKYNDAKTGITLKYNLYIPEHFDPDRSYPLVLFIHDMGVLSTDTRMTLIQGIGGAIWATRSEQAKHACFVLAPQYAT